MIATIDLAESANVFDATKEYRKEKLESERTLAA